MFDNFVFRNILRNIEGPGELSQRSNPEYDDIPALVTVSSRIFQAQSAVSGKEIFSNTKQL